MKALQKIAEDVASGTQAQAILNAITFDFVFHLIVLDEIFSITKVLSKYLQNVDISICAAHHKVSAVLQSLKELRTDLEFDNYWKEANEISKQLQLEAPQLPRQRKVLCKLDGGESQPAYGDVNHYFQISKYYPILDIMIGQIQENDMEIIPSIETLLLADNSSSVSQTIFEQVVQFYNIDKDDLKVELRVFINSVKEKEQQRAKEQDGKGCSACTS